jgi:hypothetical protein
MAACGNNSTDTSPSATTPTTSTERFDAILVQRASAFYSFQVNSSGSVSINLASLSSLTRPGALSAVMEIGYGVPVGEGCNVQNSIQTMPGLTSQLTGTLPGGIYCANIADIGNLTEPVNFTIRITHP